MHPRHLLPLLAAALALGFAPVPPPRTGVAEATVNAFGSGANGVRQALLAALPPLLQSGRVKSLTCLKGEKSPAAWLGKRLRVEEVAPGGPVRLRLEGCRPNEALVLLTALVDVYEASGVGRHNRDVAVALLWQAQQVQAAQVAAVWQVQGGNAGVRLLMDSSVSMGRRDGPAVLQRPRLVSDGKAR
jgi:hypothetical protein